MNLGLSEETLGKIQRTLERFPQVSRAVVYGSRAKGCYNPGSDIDIALEGENLDLVVVAQLDEALDDLLLPYFFDITVLQQVENPDLLEHIQRVGKTIFQRPT